MTKKIVFITGATAGFGTAMVRRFAREGHRVIATGRRKNRLEKLCKERGTKNILPLTFDVRDRAATERASNATPLLKTEVSNS